MHVRRPLHAFGTLVALAGLTAGSLALLAGPAGAATCAGTAVASCTMTGTVTLGAGTLTITTPTSLAWAATLSGVPHSVADVRGPDEQYTVNDATGSGAGWNVTVSATTFTNGSATFPDTGTFETNGNPADLTDLTAPTAACTGATADCTLPTETGVTYPVAITTAAATPTPVTIYNATATTGLGSILIGGSAAANPVGWWINVPGTAVSGAYTSTITVAVATGPTAGP